MPYLKKNLNAPRPSEHPPVWGKKCHFISVPTFSAAIHFAMKRPLFRRLATFLLVLGCSRPLLVGIDTERSEVAQETPTCCSTLACTLCNWAYTLHCGVPPLFMRFVYFLPKCMGSAPNALFFCDIYIFFFAATLGWRYGRGYPSLALRCDLFIFCPSTRCTPQYTFYCFGNFHLM